MAISSYRLLNRRPAHGTADSSRLVIDAGTGRIGIVDLTSRPANSDAICFEPFPRPPARGVWCRRISGRVTMAIYVRGGLPAKSSCFGRRIWPLVMRGLCVPLQVDACDHEGLLSHWSGASDIVGACRCSCR